MGAELPTGQRDRCAPGCCLSVPPNPSWANLLAQLTPCSGLSWDLRQQGTGQRASEEATAIAGAKSTSTTEVAQTSGSNAATGVFMTNMSQSPLPGRRTP